MSEVKVNKISPRSGTAVTLGDSGDTFTIPSGATLAIAGSVSGFTSAGIDDNATSVAITISSDEDVTFTEDILLGDSKKAIFGAGSDLQIYHDGSNSYVDDAGSGRLFLRGNDRVQIQKYTGEDMINCLADGAVNIYYDNAKKFETTATGVAVTGSIGVDGAATFNESSADVDFRVESNGDENCFFVDGGSDSIGVGTGAPDVATYFGKVINMKGASAGIMFDRNGNQKYSVGVTTGGRLDFALGAAQQMSLMDSGDFYVGATSGSIGNAGFKTFGTSTSNKSGINIVVEGGNVPVSANRLTSDGTLINFYQATSLEGTISVSGSTVSYNGFTGTHWSRFIDNSTPTILRGTVLETLDQMCDWYNLEFDVTQNEQTWKEKIPHVLLDSQSNGDTVTYNHEGTDYQATIVKETDVKHMMSKVSDTTDAKNVYGVFSAYDLDGEGYNDFYVASVGSYVVRIKSGETIAKGDLLQSNGDGTAKVQSDDNVKSSSFAKVLSTTVIETYEDGSFIVPCSLMC